MNLFYKSTPDEVIIGEKNTNILVSANATETGYDNISSITNWDNLGVAGSDYLTAKLAIKDILDNAVGATEQDRFNTFSDAEKELIIKYNNVSDSVAVPFLMSYLSQNLATASTTYMGIVLKSIEDNSLACKARLANKPAWWSILFTYFDQSVALSIKEDARYYLQDYKDEAKFGIYVGDSSKGILDFINNTGSVIISLEDYALKADYQINNNSTDYDAVKSALTTYFYG